jgi:hypothetical protein
MGIVCSTSCSRLQEKKFDVFVGFPINVNDLKVLHKFAYYIFAQYHGPFASNNSTSQHGFPPYSR